MGKVALYLPEPLEFLVQETSTARPERARLGMTLEPLLWLHCSISGRCPLEYIIGTLA